MTIFEYDDGAGNRIEASLASATGALTVNLDSTLGAAKTHQFPPLFASVEEWALLTVAISETGQVKV